MDALLSRCHHLSTHGPPPNSPSFTPRRKQMLVDALTSAASSLPQGRASTASTNPDSPVPSTEPASVTPAQKVAPSELVMCGVADLSPGHNRGRAVALAVVCPVDARNDFPPSLHLVLDGVGGYAVSALYQADFLSAAAAVTPDHHHSDSASGASGGLVSRPNFE